jgi:hypothetical protein
MWVYLETSNNDRNFPDEASGRCRFEGSCIHRCKFRTGAKARNLPPVSGFLPAETPDCARREPSLSRFESLVSPEAREHNN